MSSNNNSVYINKIAKFLPGEVVLNDEMEQFLGYVGGDLKSKSKPLILRNNKITKRYYALDKQGKSTYSNTELTVEAIKGLVSEDFQLDKIELLTCGTTTPDQILPAHATMVHGELKGHSIEAITFAGSCCAGMNALKYAYMSVLTGNTKNAITTGSEKFSQWMIANNFSEEAEKIKLIEERPILGFEKDFLRWMLSDGAAAVLLSNTPSKVGLNLKIEWIEICSYANELETCMYSGGEKNEDGSIKGWATFEQKEWLEKSLFSLRQDTKLLDNNIARLGTMSYIAAFKKHNVDPLIVDWFLPHISSEYFRSKVDDEMKSKGIQLAQEKWFVNLSQIGNIGSASIFLALEELINSGKLIKGQKIVITVPESARFSFANALLTVC